MPGTFSLRAAWTYHANGLPVDACLNVLHLRGDHMLTVGKNGTNFKVWFRDNYVT